MSVTGIILAAVIVGAPDYSLVYSSALPVRNLR